jgi:hypothetical protein
MSSGQAVRPSQFVLTYGVGSILETPNGPRVIMSYKDWGRIFGRPDTSLELCKYEIKESNVSSQLKGGRIFRLPTNADLKLPDDQALFRTKRFPQWGLCQTHRKLYPITSYGTSKCPHCGPTKRAQEEAIRFVRACPRGHLDDVAWADIVHQQNPVCKHQVFDWIETGSALWDIRIQCPKCGSIVSLKDIYYGPWICSGRVVENDLKEACDEHASIVLRNASNLRVAELVSAVTIPPMTTNIHRILENTRVLPILASEETWTKNKLIEKLRTASKRFPEINSITISEIEHASEANILSAIKDLLQPSEQTLSERDVKAKELEALRHAALYGAPPQQFSEPQDFEVDKDAIRNSVELSPNLFLRITPVKRLRVVTAQKGYIRPIRGLAKAKVDNGYFDGQDKWHVGVELIGEGIFIDLPPGKQLSLKNTSTEEVWFKAHEETNSPFFHPLFVWYHTLSHRLITALSIDSGYSAASIRERIYLSKDSQSGITNGGILLYTTQSGGDGSLGGLIALVPDFERVLKAAQRNIYSCSNDPLCGEQKLASEKPNGAACYACLLVSETSCEFGNIYLDRNLMKENLL